MAVLGPEDGAAKTVIEAALQRARDEKSDQLHQRSRWTPDVVQERTRVRVTRLEQALQAMGDLQCAEADMLQGALKRAHQSAQECPLANQISECTLIERSTHRLAKIDAEREAEVAALEEARSRLAREAQSKMCPPDVPMSTATKTGSDVIAELEELKRSSLACKRQAMSRTLMVRERTPPQIPDSMIPAELSSRPGEVNVEVAVEQGPRLAPQEEFSQVENIQSVRLGRRLILCRSRQEHHVPCRTGQSSVHQLVMSRRLGPTPQGKVLPSGSIRGQ